MAVQELNYLSITIDHPSVREREGGKQTEAWLNLVTIPGGQGRRARMSEEQLLRMIEQAATALRRIRS